MAVQLPTGSPRLVALKRGWKTDGAPGCPVSAGRRRADLGRAGFLSEDIPFIVCTEVSGGQNLPPPEARASLILRSLSAIRLIRFDGFPTEVAARAVPGELYRHVFTVEGRGATAAYAILIEYALADVREAAIFEASHWALFALRRQYLSGFVSDTLLGHLDDRGRYLVVGLYRDRSGLHLARHHPEIARFTETSLAATRYVVHELGKPELLRVFAPRQ